jgi:hypothetical protein
MSGPKRNPDKLNTIGIVVVGICGAVLVYVTIVGLQAFYVGDSADVQTMADYGGQDTTAKGHKALEMQNITETASNPAGTTQTYRIPVDRAMRLVVDDAKRDPSHLVPALPASTKPTIAPTFGRPSIGGAAAAGSGSAAPAEGSGSGSAAPAGSGSAVPAGSAAPAGGNGH